MKAEFPDPGVVDGSVGRWVDIDVVSSSLRVDARTLIFCEYSTLKN